MPPRSLTQPGKAARAGPAAGEARSPGFLIAYALAQVGGVIGYLPLLTLLLPIKIERVAGAARIDLLTAVAVAGALVASVANIAFGWLSDRVAARGWGRRGAAGVGVAALALSYIGLAAAETPAHIVAAVMTFQIAVNALLAPLAAIMAEEIPDRQKGTVGGMLALGNPAAAALAAVLVGMTARSEAWRLAVVSAVVAACVLPFLLACPHRPAAPPVVRPAVIRLRRDLASAWVARLLVQTASIAVSLYLLYFVEDLLPAAPRTSLGVQVGRLVFLGSALALPVAMLLGRLSDRIGRRKPVLVTAAGLAAAALVAMATVHDWRATAIAFVAYTVCVAVFLSVHTAYAMQLLPDPAYRGRDLGVVNLTNTLPSLLGPSLAWLLAAPSHYPHLLLVLAVLTAAGGAAMLGPRNSR